MKKIAAILVGVSIAFAGTAFAKPDYGKGGKCTACHADMKDKKKLTPKAEEMMKKYKVEECKNCHTGKPEAGKDLFIKK